MKDKKTIFDIHICNVMPKFQSCRLNGVATIEKTIIHTYIFYPHTYKHPAQLNTQNIFFSVIAKDKQTFMFVDKSGQCVHGTSDEKTEQKQKLGDGFVATNFIPWGDTAR